MKIRNRVKELRMVPAKDLLANPKNWRDHPEEQRSAMRQLLERIGFAGANMARETPEGLQLIDGHLRKELADESIVPVLIVDVTEAEADEILATFDPIASMATANSDKLRALTESLTMSAGPLLDMIKSTLSDACQDLKPDVVAEDAPLPLAAQVTQRGDVWILGKHRLMCGDSANPANVDTLLAGAVIDLVNSDPPYNVAVEPRSNNAIATGSWNGFQPMGEDRRKATHHQKSDLARHPEKTKPTTKKMRAKDRPLANDFVTDEAFDDLLAAWFGNFTRVLKPGGSFYIWGGYANLANYPPALKNAGLYFSQAIVWDKMHPVLGRKDFMGAFEIAFYGWKEGAGHHFYGPNNVTDLWHLKKVNPQNMVHLTEKPVELAAVAMSYSSKPDENVLDLFGGSGSTLIACEQQNRRGFLMELDTAYNDVIVRRWQKLTGRHAVHAETKKTWTEMAAERGIDITE